MRDIIIVSESPLDVKECRKLISKEIQDCRINGEKGIIIEKPYSLFLDCSNDKLSDLPEDSFSPEEIEKIKSCFKCDNLFLSDVNYHRSIDVKRIITALMSNYPKLFVIAEDEEEWFGSADDYLKTEFTY